MNMKDFIFLVAWQAYMLGYAQGEEAGQREGGVLPETLRKKLSLAREGAEVLLTLSDMMMLTGWSRNTILKNIPAVRNGGHPAWRYSTYLEYCKKNESKHAGETKREYRPVDEKDDSIMNAAVQKELADQIEKLKKRRAA
ncbi:MAG: hypothetical protein GTO45_20440 [Candidatus Aminicenantes bacterium]|nr:hypothetical protein [Candidatus Aminicenantes bacterium]NIM82228.1 hypothetical protein [Candidatus Aminicenantes bacterium]NIN21630.1 hypothetical protein [Candidatus Aminicenantes bacterium]NIN44311.1 hypothetical protein [Candidatus Aminicenantes bacterium]NIN87130.1 hypothetical protein [Candidatus Aminicenantes bacterium]